nr:hypothetical protein [Pseudonocardia sp. H11422]
MDLDQPAHAGGGEGLDHPAVGGDQIQPDVGLAGVADQLDQRRPSAGGQAGHRAQIQHYRPRGCGQQPEDDMLESGHRGVVEAALHVHARHPGPQVAEANARASPRRCGSVATDAVTHLSHLL